MSRPAPLFKEYQPTLRKMWEGMVIDPSRAAQFASTARRVAGNLIQYQSIEAATGVPAVFIGLAHLRESNCNFSTHLHNGDSLKARTIHEPAGRPLHPEPPYSFFDSAVDALRGEGLDTVHWSLEMLLYKTYAYNGFGYYMYHPEVETPYLWAGTNWYTKGKYDRDSHFDPNLIDVQLGVAGVLKKIFELEPRLIVPFYADVVAIAPKHEPTPPVITVVPESGTVVVPATAPAPVPVGTPDGPLALLIAGLFRWLASLLRGGK